MSDDFEGIPLDLPSEVPAEIQIDGQVTEDNTGEQVANEAGNPAWWDDNYPGQTVQNPNTVTENVFDPRQEVQESVFNPAAAVPDPYLGLTPDQIKDLGGADPTDPYIRARLGIPQLPGSPLSSLPSTSGFFNSLTSVATSVAPTIQKALSTFTGSATSPSQSPYGQILSTAQKAVSALTTKTPATSPYAQTPVIQKSLSALTSNAITPTQDAYGLTILDAAQTAQLNSKINPALVNGFAPAVDTGAGNAIAEANQQTVIEAARLNAYSENPNPYLTNIDQAGVEIAKGQAGIATANQTIQSAQQKISDSESYIAQNNAELADPNISAERRAQLEANNAAQVQNVLDQTQSINENQAYITNTQDVIDANNVVINDNAAVYRDSTNPAITTTVPINVDPNVTVAETATATATATANAVNPTRTATAVDATTLEGYGVNEVGATGAIFGLNPDAEAEAASAAQVGRQLAQQQAVLQAQKRIPNNSDWRVRLSLAPGANYLYNAPTGPNGAGPGILWPLAQTGGVIFPYTPRIETAYKADYDTYSLTHSNYRGYFYKSSYTDAVNVMATFTAQDTNEAQYLLAVIHFFRSVTKMFYGQDAERGAPPPLVYLTGLGEYQFSRHPCVVTSFNYTLPNDVDYIRARSINVNGTDLLTRRTRQDLPNNPISGAVARLQNLFSSQGINKGAINYPPPTPNLGENQPTYVPTKMDIGISLLPIQSRQQVSRVFSLRQYANGDQLKGGFW